MAGEEGLLHAPVTRKSQKRTTRLHFKRERWGGGEREESCIMFLLVTVGLLQLLGLAGGEIGQDLVFAVDSVARKQ